MREVTTNCKLTVRWYRFDYSTYISRFILKVRRNRLFKRREAEHRHTRPSERIFALFDRVRLFCRPHLVPCETMGQVDCIVTKRWLGMHKQAGTTKGTHNKRHPTNAGQQRYKSHKRQFPNQAVQASN